MKAEELRSGNLVQHQLTKEIITIKSYHIQTLEEGMDQDILQGIPLTEDWLLRFGFEYRKVDVGVGLYKEHLYFIEKPTFYINYEEGKGITPMDSGALPSLWFKNVHQLQNLYYALTNTELTLKE